MTRILNIVVALLPALSIPTRLDAAEPIRVGAAISLKEALTRSADAFTKDTGVAVEMTFGSSGQILGQIRNGAPIDLFISAAHKQIDDLEKEGLAEPKTRRVIAGNVLVLIVPADADERSAPRSVADLAKPSVKRIAIGEPKTVPAGQYATQALQITRARIAGPRPADLGTNVRQVLDYVERGEVDAGIVYATDAGGRRQGPRRRVDRAATPRFDRLPRVRRRQQHPQGRREAVPRLPRDRTRARRPRSHGFTVPAETDDDDGEAGRGDRPEQPAPAGREAAGTR